MMTALEVREYRATCLKLIEADERGKLLKELLRNNVCFNEEEFLIQKPDKKFRVLGEKENVLDKKHEEIVKVTLKYKIKDNDLDGVKLRKKRDKLKWKLEMSLGMRSQEWRRIFEDIRALGVKHRDKIRKKNRKKVKHLVRKHGRRPKSGWEDLPKPWRTTMGNPRIFNDKEDLLKEDVKEPMVVKGMEEDLSLTDSEMELLKLGPKFCVYKNLSEEEFETDIEECIMKVKWDLMKDDGKKAPGTEDIALEVLLGSEVCRSIEEEAEEEEDILDAERRTIFDWRTRTMNFGRRRATDCKGNSRVFFPRKARTVEEEMSLQTLRDMLMVTFRKYVDEKCGKEGKQCRNLSKVQEAGLKSLKKRVKEGEVMIVHTDKSGSLAVMSRTAYV